MAETPVSTIVTVNGQSFKLKHIAKEEADKLYVALGQATDDKGGLLVKDGKAEFQVLADAMSDVALHFQDFITIERPDGMSPDKFLKNFTKALKETGGKASELADPYFKKFATTGLGKVIVHNPITQTGEGLAAITNAIVEMGDGLANHGPVSTFHNFVDASGATITELGNKLDTRFDHIKPEDAKRLGTAYAASVYASQYGESSTAYEPDFLDKIWARAQAIFGSIGKVVGKFAPFIPAAFKYVGKGFKDWDTCLAEVKDGRDQPNLGYAEHLEENIKSKRNKTTHPLAAKIFEATEEVAGISTKNLSSLVNEGGIFRDDKGAWKLLSFNEKTGLPKADDIKDDLGQPITADSKVNEKWNKLFPESNWAKIGMLGGFAIVGDVAHGFARGTMSKLVGSSTSLSKDVAQWQKDLKIAAEGKPGIKVKTPMGDKTFNAKAPDPALATKLEEKITNAQVKLEGREALFGENLTKLAEARAPKWFDIFNRSGELLGKGFGVVGDKAIGAVGLDKSVAGLAEKGLAETTGVVTKLVDGKLIQTEAHMGGSKMFYVVDGVQGLTDLYHGNTRGVLENGMQLSSGYFGSKLAVATTEELLLKAPLPGRAKLLIGLAGFLGGREGGEFLTNKILPATPQNQDPGLDNATTKSTLSAQKIQQLQDDGKIIMDDETFKALQKYSESNQNAVIAGVNNTSLQSVQVGRK